MARVILQSLLIRDTVYHVCRIMINVWEETRRRISTDREKTFESVVRGWKAEDEGRRVSNLDSTSRRGVQDRW